MLLREEDDGLEQYTVAFDSAGYTCSCIPVLESETYGMSALRSVLEQQNPSCYILTSHRAASALKTVLEGVDVTSPLRSLPMHCVGPRTASALEGIRSSCATPRCAGTAAALVPEILDCLRSMSTEETSALDGSGGGGCASCPPALFVCGDRRLDTIPAALRAQGYACLELPVYRTQAAPLEDIRSCWEASLTIKGEVAGGGVVAAVYFSPSGVEAAAAAGVLGDPRVPVIVAIGPTTAQALKMAGYEATCTASRPTAEGVLEAILRTHS